MSHFTRLLLSLIIFYAHACAAEGETYVLLVGVSMYNANSGLSNLRFAESDMTALADVFRTIGVKKHNVTLLLQGGGGADRFRPNLTHIQAEIKLLLEEKTKDSRPVSAAACNRPIVPTTFSR